MYWRITFDKYKKKMNALYCFTKKNIIQNNWINETTKCKRSKNCVNHSIFISVYKKSHIFASNTNPFHLSFVLSPAGKVRSKALARVVTIRNALIAACPGSASHLLCIQCLQCKRRLGIVLSSNHCFFSSSSSLPHGTEVSAYIYNQFRCFFSSIKSK